MDHIFNCVIGALTAAGVASPRMEARIICAFATGKEADMYCGGETADEQQQKKIMELCARRCRHEPLDKIIGYKEFYKFRFSVSPDVLSPRPDSELLVEKALELAQKYGLKRIFEFGVGSGCLLLSILADLPQAEGVGIDKSEKALAIARANSVYLGVGDRARLHQIDYMQDKVWGNYDLIISNPPYIPSADIVGLDTEVKNYDPLTALDGGADGLDHYRKLAELAPGMLNDGGYVLLEAGIGQAGGIKEIFCRNELSWVATYRDLGGIDRCIIFKK